MIFLAIIGAVLTAIDILIRWLQGGFIPGPKQREALAQLLNRQAKVQSFCTTYGISAAPDVPPAPPAGAIPVSAWEETC